MLKSQKIEFVKRISKEIKGSKTVGIMPIDSLPDRLMQKIRNDIKPNSKLYVMRKNLLSKALEGAGFESLSGSVKGNVALILSDADPFDLYGSISGNSIKLIAKPGQVSPEDISVESGETAIAPGQAVTDLKAAGIDVQIQKGKVVIGKSKVIVSKGTKISIAVSKALKMLDILPFEAKGRVSVLSNGGLTFTEDILKVNTAYVTGEISRAFSAAYGLTLETGFPTEYNIREFIAKAFVSAVGLGVEAKVYDTGVSEKLAGIASLQASALNALIKKEE